MLKEISSTLLPILGSLVLASLIIIGSVEFGVFKSIAENNDPIVGACALTGVLVFTWIGGIIGFLVTDELLEKFVKKKKKKFVK